MKKFCLSKQGRALSRIERRRGLCLALILGFILALIPSNLACKKGTNKQGLGNGQEPVSSMKLEYASEFAVDYYDGGYKLITLGDGSRFLTVPEGSEPPKGLDKEIAIISQPLGGIYLAASGAMCFFDGLERLDAIAYSGTKAGDWYIENAKAAIENGSIKFAGKYSEPDYELLLSGGCALAIENTMIGHASDVKDQLEKLGIPVLVERSSFEKHPLGRTEWIKLYAALLNEEDKAESVFAEQKKYVDALGDAPNTGKTVVFFHISSSGYAVCRKSGDYVSRMIELAGGKYVFDDLGDPSSASATVNVEMESFFDRAREADIVIYNSTIAGTVEDLEGFLALNPMLSELKAVRNGNVWCTNRNMYQQSLEFGQMIHEFNIIMNATDNTAPKLDFLYHLD